MLRQPRYAGEWVVQTTLLDDAREFRAPQTMTPAELGDSLARLVWESFSDFLAQEEVESPLPEVDALYDDEHVGEPARAAGDPRDRPGQAGGGGRE